MDDTETCLGQAIATETDFHFDEERFVQLTLCSPVPPSPRD